MQSKKPSKMTSKAPKERTQAAPSQKQHAKKDMAYDYDELFYKLVYTTKKKAEDILTGCREEVLFGFSALLDDDFNRWKPKVARLALPWPTMTKKKRANQQTSKLPGAFRGICRYFRRSQVQMITLTTGLALALTIWSCVRKSWKPWMLPLIFISAWPGCGNMFVPTWRMARVPPLFNGDYRSHLLKPCICASMMMGNKMLSTFHKYDWFSPPKQSLHNHGQHFLYFCCFTESLGQGFREALPEAFVHSERSEKQPIARSIGVPMSMGIKDMSPSPTRIQNSCLKVRREG